MEKFEKLFEEHMMGVCAENPDPSHDMLHVKRVVNLARKLAARENAELNVVVPAAWLHDCVYISKADPRRKQSSRISADKAMELLEKWEYPKEFWPGIHHAILTHSFSAGITPETLEAKIVQDADRLDAVGAIGIFRCFAFSGLARRPFYNVEDPFSKNREPNDADNTLDHFYTKLLHLQAKLNTESAKKEGLVRLESMNHFLGSLEREIGTLDTGF